jgi:hypothetical protein
MGKRIELTPNQKLFTTKGIETKWTYLHDVELKRYGKTVRRIIKVQCECGKTKEVQLNNITGGHSVCCGYNPCKIPFNKNKRSPETTYNLLYGAYKRGAISRGLDFELDMNQFKSFIDKNCYYCNSEPNNIYQVKNSKTGEIRAGIPITYNGIDRLDNTKGYIINNCITCCETCNKMKHAHEYEVFLNHVKKIYENKFGGLQI